MWLLGNQHVLYLLLYTVRVYWCPVLLSFTSLSPVSALDGQQVHGKQAHDGHNSHILKSITAKFKEEVGALTAGDVLHHVLAAFICSLPATKEWLSTGSMPVGSYVHHLLPNKFLLTDLMPLIYRHETSSAHTWRSSTVYYLMVKNVRMIKQVFLNGTLVGTCTFPFCRSLISCRHSRARCCSLHIPSVFGKTVVQRSCRDLH